MSSIVSSTSDTMNDSLTQTRYTEMNNIFRWGWDKIMSGEAKTIERLRAWHPLDWAKLFYWLLLKPARLAQHRDNYRQIAEIQTGACLVAVVVCIPLLIWLLPIQLEVEWQSIIFQRHQISLPIYILLIIVFWITISVLGGHKNPQMSLIAGAFALGVGILMANIVMFYLKYNVAIVVTGALTICIGLSIAGESSEYVAITVLIGSMLGMALGILMMQADVIIFVVSGIVALIMVSFIMITIVKWGSDIIVKGIINRKLSQAHYRLATILLMSYLGLIGASLSFMIA